MKRLLLSMLVAVATSSASAEEAPVSSIPKHLQLARELVATVTPENNLYNIRPSKVPIRWKGDLFTSENAVSTHCVGLVDAVLDRADSPTPKAVKRNTSWQYAVRVNNYFEASKKGLGLTHIESLNDVRPGDLFMFSCKDICTTLAGDTAQGHITFINAAPRKAVKELPPVIAGTTQWFVEVIDSSDAPHGPTDTRVMPKGTKFATGIGIGIYRIYTDESGVPVGYAGERAKKFFPIEQRQIELSRPL